MKTRFKMLVLLVVTGLIMVSCEKNEEFIVDPEIKTDNPFIGTWDWSKNSDRYSYGYTFADTTFVHFEAEANYPYERKGVYDYTDTKITFKYIPDEGEAYFHEYEYTIDGNNLTIAGELLNKRD